MKVVIVGKTEAGNTFRPSDWAHRLAGHFSCPEGKICRYDQDVTLFYEDGTQCFSLDNPSDDAIAYLQWFASTNNLISYQL